MYVYVRSTGRLDDFWKCKIEPSNISRNNDLHFNTSLALQHDFKKCLHVKCVRTIKHPLEAPSSWLETS